MKEDPSPTLQLLHNLEQLLFVHQLLHRGVDDVQVEHRVQLLDLLQLEGVDLGERLLLELCEMEQLRDFLYLDALPGDLALEVAVHVHLEVDRLGRTDSA